MRLKTIRCIAKQTFNDFFADRILKLSAALAYYTLFSLPGLLIIVIWFLDIFYGQKTMVEGSVYGQISQLVGPDAAHQIQQTILNSINSGQNKIAAIVGLVTLIFGATSVFGEIQDSINQIWRLKSKPKKGMGWVKMIVNRLLSFSIIISLGFLLMVSLIINSIMDFFINHLNQVFPNTQVAVAYISNLVLTFFITSLLFGLIFKVLPDARIEWKHVRAGAFTTAILFMGGKYLIGLYLGQNTMTTAYGAAGSVIVVLLWVYFSAIILYFGAVFTRAFAMQTGSHIYPNNYAVWVEQVEVQSQQSIQKQPETKTVIEGPQQEKRE
jgi:membrane protein